MGALTTVGFELGILFLLGASLYELFNLPELVRDRYERGKRDVPDRDE